MFISILCDITNDISVNVTDQMRPARAASYNTEIPLQVRATDI